MGYSTEDNHIPKHRDLADAAFGLVRDSLQGSAAFTVTSLVVHVT